ncbi:TadE family protein [Paraburkholderia dinghuensis]|uniref:TadE family protein n=1 Tax=Paraburkholderia dinghuensis TaxID=2305225 RepID=UPI001FE8BFFE|nr:TadE family protein [Paraburkholderia dinghuensis]
MVEFALVLPLLLLVLFGIMETGFLLYDKAVITNASRAAARQAVAFGEDSTGAPLYMSPASATAIAKNGFSGMLISPAPASGATVTLTLCSSPTSTSCVTNTPCSVTGQSLTVAVSYPFTGLSLGSGTILGMSINPLASVSKNLLTLNASTTMNCE